MIINVPDLSDEVRAINFAEAAAGLNEVLAAGSGWSEQRFEHDLDVHAEAYRHGTDVYVGGSLDGMIHCTCRRCLDDVDRPLRREFRFLLVKADRGGRGLDDDTGVDHYEGIEIDLSRLVKEQAVLALDGSVLCSDECQGLCSGCGVNRNRDSCRCEGANRQTD